VGHKLLVVRMQKRALSLTQGGGLQCEINAE